MATFREEAGGYVEDFIAGLLSLEQGLEPSVRRELLDELYRKAHSLKGAAQVSGQLAQGSAQDHFQPGAPLEQAGPQGSDRAPAW